MRYNGSTVVENLIWLTLLVVCGAPSLCWCREPSCLKIISFLYLNKAKLLAVLNANISKSVKNKYRLILNLVEIQFNKNTADFMISLNAANGQKLSKNCNQKINY